MTAHVEGRGMALLPAAVFPDVAPERMPFWRSTVRGFSQCAFQANELTALCFVLAAFSFDWRMGVFYVVSVVVGTATAALLGGDRTLLGLGLFGFNSGLMGLALGNFFVPGAALWVAMVGLAALVGAATVLLAKVLPLPFLAAPFIAAFWLLWPFATWFGLEPKVFEPFPDDIVKWVESVVSAMGSTLFAAGVVPGLLFLLGLLVASWRHAVIAVLGALIAVTLAVYVGVAGVAVNSGFIGFNAVLAALAAYTLIAADLRLAVFAAVLSSWIFAWFNRDFPAPALASGFVLTVWIIVLLGRLNPWFSGIEESEAPAEAPAEATGA